MTTPNTQNSSEDRASLFAELPTSPEDERVQIIRDALTLAISRAESELRMWPVKQINSVEHESLRTYLGKLQQALDQLPPK
jgi:hypothetical protein